MGLSRIDSEINGDFNRNRNFSHSMPLKPLLREFPLEFRNGGSAQKPRVMLLHDVRKSLSIRAFV